MPIPHVIFVGGTILQQSTLCEVSIWLLFVSAAEQTYTFYICKRQVAFASVSS